MSTMKDRLHTGEIYFPNDSEIMEDQLRRLERLYDFNQTRPLEQEKRQAMLKEMFAEIGEGCYIEPPLHSNFGGGHVHFGKYVYANFSLTLVDDTHIYIGDYATPSCPSCGSGGSSSICRCASAATAGWARGPSSCPASPSATMWWWARAAW